MSTLAHVASAAMPAENCFAASVAASPRVTMKSSAFVLGGRLYAARRDRVALTISCATAMDSSTALSVLSSVKAG